MKKSRAGKKPHQTVGGLAEKNITYTSQRQLLVNTYNASRHKSLEKLLRPNNRNELHQAPTDLFTGQKAQQICFNIYQGTPAT